MREEQKPYVAAEANLPELTWKALFLGVVLAAVMGAANAYLALKAGQTVSATFPAAILALAAFRLPFFRGNVLEQTLHLATPIAPQGAWGRHRLRCASPVPEPGNPARPGGEGG